MKNVTIAQALEIGRHLAHVKRTGLADSIGGFSEFIALCGYTRQQADRLVALAMRTERTV
ncbi:hypothetical protein PghCCS26_47220 [Paenibacillus glycanilyticus]|uniref:Uncharacterized protein n=1 Tax=Paenibacillus glycanilyticus TaxID=126569 RepID=A0ABQ6NR69_9BACL|nr:hypothetical protein [Paenibacillus glycanilyticus]GMK47592.1 hypothetical protein PghCCS26_47220 [Paenibacillus glycanilyticus]